MKTRPTVLLAGLFHETNTFADGKTTLADFTVLRGNELLTMRADASPLGAFIRFAEQLDWRLLPVADYRATPSAMVTNDVVDSFWADFVTQAAQPLKDAKIDAIFLILHGAMVSDGCDDVEGEILARIRALPGAATLPIFGVLDLHTNLTARMVQNANGLVAYRENPHTDAANAAVVAGMQLERALREKRLPQFYARQMPIVWPPTGTATAVNPMASLKAAAIELEQSGHWSASIIAGFANADTADTGVSFILLTDSPPVEAERALDKLATTALRHAAEGYPAEWDVNEAINQILANASARPALLVEPADNIGGGAPGDCTSVLRALLKHKHLPPTGIAINDPEAVATLQDTPIGASLGLAIGGKGSRLDPGPVELEVTLVSRSDGRFELEDKQSHLASMSGAYFDMGQSAVVRHDSITILLTSNPTPPFDLGQWRSQGIDPSQFGIINIKAAVAHRRAYDRICGASYTVDTPGPCSSNLKQLPYRKLRRPVMPLDTISDNPNSTKQNLGKAL